MCRPVYINLVHAASLIFIKNCKQQCTSISYTAHSETGAVIYYM
jgi:hypothetical protein